ncbi:hypothetical protein M15_03840 [Atrimonas thermophila]
MGECKGAVIPLNLLRGYTDPLALAFTAGQVSSDTISRYIEAQKIEEGGE